jgi:hypothetical protein
MAQIGGDVREKWGMPDNQNPKMPVDDGVRRDGPAGWLQVNSMEGG